MKWTEAVSVHVEEIDAQHKKLLELINHAHEIDWGEDFEDGKEILNELIEFTRVHFTTEEIYFERCGYPGAKAHIEDHARYILKILELQKKCENGVCSPPDILAFLKTWWEGHLIKMDLKYVKNFQACGLK